MGPRVAANEQKPPMEKPYRQSPDTILRSTKFSSWVTHICPSEQGRREFRWRLGAYLALSNSFLNTKIFLSIKFI